jgi:lysophospholipase L1-like esterase
MKTRGRMVSRLLAVFIAVAGLVALGAPTATAGKSHTLHYGQPRTLQYVALGDSYAAGRGAGDYINVGCKVSANGYPALLNARKHVNLRANASCSGKTTSDVLNTQLSALNRWTTLVTLTVGANDLGVAAVAAACSPVPTAACQPAIAQAVGQLPSLAVNLPKVYTAVAAAAPRALILVTGYPYLFSTHSPCLPSEAIMCQINTATDLLNQTIEDTVETAAQPPSGVNIKYIDVIAAFAGHGIGGSPPLFINDTGLDAYHPTAAGYKAYDAALSAALR